MMIPRGELITVAGYRDFYDIPRLILGVDQKANAWILDSGFDDGLDEYSASYKIYDAGNDPRLAREIFELHAKGKKGDVLESIATSNFEFDTTKRKEFFVSR